MKNTEVDPYVKMLFGENASRGYGQLLIQNLNGKAVSIIGTFVGLPIPTETHDYYECEIILRPINKASTSQYKGHGLPGAATAIFKEKIVN